MEYVALFIWLSLCLVLGGMIHYAMAGALTHRFVQVLAAPGMVIRKFTMSLAALACGATVTRVSIYEISSRDIDFTADGVSSVAKAVAPVAPLFGCAAAMVVLNGAFGDPLRFDYTPPALASLDTVGLRGFLMGTGRLLSAAVRQVRQVDWRSPRLYVLFGLMFSLALGAAASLERIREALLGAGLLAAALALASSIAVQHGPADLPATAPSWFVAARAAIVSTSVAGFVLMFYGMLAAIVVGMAVRIFELVMGTGSGGGKGTTRMPGPGQKRRAA
ncbi:MAG: hypothetical protein R6V05_00990 [Candidatus Brocadiia bacterium]